MARSSVAARHGLGFLAPKPFHSEVGSHPPSPWKLTALPSHWCITMFSPCA